MLHLTARWRQRQMSLLRIERVMSRGGALVADNIGVERISVATVREQRNATPCVRETTSIIEPYDTALLLRARDAPGENDCNRDKQECAHVA
jgi:hypothetical protein